MNIHATLHEAVKALNKSGTSDESKLEAQLLLERTLNVNHAWLIAHAEDEVNLKDQTQFQALIQRRMTGEPIAYILGERAFYGLNLKVTPNTLIPRSDTETLVDAALTLIPNKVSMKLLDLGTGSGAIALAIAKHRPLSKIMAVDASNEALTVAQENALNLRISNVQFLMSNWFANLQNQTYDVIVSNPPYIEESDLHLNQGDLRFEPISALTSGKDGLNDIRHIISHAKTHLNPSGWLLIEHGYNQSNQVADLMHHAEFNSIKHINDLAGIERITMAQT